MEIPSTAGSGWASCPGGFAVRAFSGGGRTVTGLFSRALGFANPPVTATAIEAHTRLPSPIGLVSLREPAWPMARLDDDGVRLKLTSLEPVAAAKHLEAELCLAAADGKPPLLAAAPTRTTDRVLA